jgi:hypothetical protein
VSVMERETGGSCPVSVLERETGGSYHVSVMERRLEGPALCLLWRGDCRVLPCVCYGEETEGSCPVYVMKRKTGGSCHVSVMERRLEGPALCLL